MAPLYPNAIKSFVWLPIQIVRRVFCTSLWGVRRLILGLACLPLIAGEVSAHDASSYGGVFRSRDLGAVWLNADVGLFLNAALVIAVDPRDSSHLLVGTDLDLVRSHDAGRKVEL